MTIPRCISLLAACSLAAISLAGAQAPPTRRELVGIVKDSTGSGIEGATVEIRGAAVGTNAKGAFQLWTSAIDTLTISIRRLGYLPISAQLAARGGQWDTVVVEMERTSQRLSAVSVAGGASRSLGLRDFDARRAVGNGIFVTHDEITSRNTTRLTDVLSNKRGIRIVRVRSGLSGVRFASYNHVRASCAPNVWVDGQWARELEVDEIPTTDIEAVELYETLGSVPFEFTPQGNNAPCGTIVIWTRIPGRS